MTSTFALVNDTPAPDPAYPPTDPIEAAAGRTSPCSVSVPSAGQNDGTRCRRSGSGCANGFANETRRDEEDAARGRRRSCTLRPAQKRYTGTPETAKTHVVWLITQRSRVQIPPPLPGQRHLPIKEGVFCMPDANGTGIHAAAPSSPSGSSAVSLTAPVTSVVTSDPPMISVGSILSAIFPASGNTRRIGGTADRRPRFRLTGICRMPLPRSMSG